MDWRDGKRHLWLLALVIPALPFAGLALHRMTNAGVWLWIGPIVILGLVPVIDLLAGSDRSSPPDDVLEALEADRYYRVLTYLYLPLQYGSFALSLWVIAGGDLTTSECVGLSVTLGFVGGVGINTAHELGHKRESVERWLSKVALAQSAYGHFYIEHNRGHHVRVATPEDPASARLGENFYAFWPRTVWGSLVDAWSIESRRLRLRGRRPWRWDNDVINAWLMTAALWAVMVAWLGLSIVPYLVVQALVAVTLLEAVNYLEHYALLRQRVMHGGRARYERVEPRHSWNSNNIATNVLLYHLQRHSDHHAFPVRRYQCLRDTEGAPVLPTGYSGMILLALVPPLWRRVMDPLVSDHFGGDLSRANVGPRYREGATSTSRQSGSVTRAPLAVSAATCPGCGYRYSVDAGNQREGLAPGTAWALVPDDWRCPDCGVREKADFMPG